MILFEIAFALWMTWGFLQIAIGLLKFAAYIVLMPFALVLDLWNDAKTRIANIKQSLQIFLQR